MLAILSSPWKAIPCLNPFFGFVLLFFFFFISAMVSTGRKEWKRMKVQELRGELSRRGLDTGGLRPALIERLEKSLDPSADAADESGALEVTENPQLQDDREISSPSNAKVPLADVVEPQVPVNVEKCGDSKELESASEPEVPVLIVEKPANDGKDNGTTNACGPMSDLEKKHRRAERFGLALQLSEEEKRQSRAARFGESPSGTLKANSPGLGDTKVSEEERRKARAERFGLSPRSYADDEAKKKARLARFGIDVKLDSLEEDKKKARATRFGSVLDSSTSEVNKKIKPELTGTVAST